MVKQPKFRTYIGYNKIRTPFTIFLVHGKEEFLLRKIQNFISTKLRFKTIVLKDEFNGKTIIEKLQEKIWEDTDCAVAIMSADDKLNRATLHARPNVLFEIGYCLGYFDQLYVEDYENEIRPVVIVKEDKTYTPSDLNGIEVIDYSKTNLVRKAHLSKIYLANEQRLELLFTQIKQYYKEDNKD